MPRRADSAYTSAIVSSPPTSVPSGTLPAACVMSEWPSSRITTSPPVADPVLSPMMSGLASALRDIRWKIQPALARQAPVNSAARMRGSRRSQATSRSSSLGEPSSRGRSDQPSG